MNFCASLAQNSTGISGGSSYGLVGDFPDEMRALTNLEHIEFRKSLLWFHLIESSLRPFSLTHICHD